ncbi:MAG TPA: cysteine--tRNA ligase [Actinomycetes bacterium]|jgi:cysteinyl-tRNA synthetase|nr:cysteine--tRNA ligase [Actinomycetes bacterium]
MLRVTNTLTRTKEQVRPRTAGMVRMYTCGPTVYRSAHIGNLRTFLLADLVRRVLEADGIKVRQVQNITDVGHLTNERFDRGEDRMLLSARLEHKTPAEIAEHYTRTYLADAAAMNLRPAHAHPRASDYVPQMVELVQRLLDKDHAYEVEGNVYFSVESFPQYGKLSRNTIDQLRAGHRQEGVDPRKRHHADFTLWKAAGPGRIVKWGSPWSEGFPGWHIECSAMSLGELGEHIDVHTGGVDNVFPHHEDEIAQSEALVGHQVVSTWVHGEHLLSEGRRMAKSAGNFHDLSSVRERGHSPLAVRHLFLQARYRSQFNFTWEALAGAERALERLRARMGSWARDRSAVAPDGPGPSATAATRPYQERFRAAIEDDLDTPRALAVLNELEADETLPPSARFHTVGAFDRVLGLDLARAVAAELPPGAEQLIERRQLARADRDWATADRLREQLAAMGVEVVDTRAGPTWRRRR